MADDNTIPPINAAVHRDGDVVLRDGSTVRIRVMRPEDEIGLCALLTSLSEDSRWLRFYCLQNSAGLAAEAHREANLDHAFGLIAFSGDEERVVGQIGRASCRERE